MSLFIVSDFKDIIILEGEESRHCYKVLRKKNGDLIQLTDGAGTYGIGRISNIDKHRCQLEIIERKFVEQDSFHIHIAMVPVKNHDRMEWFVEKATEIGIHEISFVSSEYSERKTLNTQRLIKKARSALKQSGRFYLPTIHELDTLNHWIEKNQADEMFVAHPDKQNNSLLNRAAIPGNHYLLLIGPEGGFSDKEIHTMKQRGYRSVSLGKNILRAETAGIVGCQMFCEINFDTGK